MQIASLLEAARNNAVRLQFFDRQFQLTEWSPGSAGEAVVSAAQDGKAFELTFDVSEDGACHRRQTPGVKKCFAALCAVIKASSPLFADGKGASNV